MASIFNIDEWFTELFQDIARSSVNCFVGAVQEMPENYIIFVLPKHNSAFYMTVDV